MLAKRCRFRDLLIIHHKARGTCGRLVGRAHRSPQRCFWFVSAVVCPVDLLVAATLSAWDERHHLYCCWRTEASEEEVSVQAVSSTRLRAKGTGSKSDSHLQMSGQTAQAVAWFSGARGAYWRLRSPCWLGSPRIMCDGARIDSDYSGDTGDLPQEPTPPCDGEIPVNDMWGSRQQDRQSEEVVNGLRWKDFDGGSFFKAGSVFCKL